MDNNCLKIKGFYYLSLLSSNPLCRCMTLNCDTVVTRLNELLAASDSSNVLVSCSLKFCVSFCCDKLCSRYTTTVSFALLTLAGCKIMRR